MPNLHNSLIIERLTNTQVSREWTVGQSVHSFPHMHRNRVLYRSGGDSTSPHLPDLSTCLSCVKSNPRWSRQSRTTPIGRLRTPASPLRTVSARSTFTATWSLRSTKILWNSMMVDTRATPPNPVSMPSVLRSVTLVRTSFRRTGPGSSVSGMALNSLQLSSVPVCV